MLKVPSLLSMGKSRFVFQGVDQAEGNTATGCKSHDEPEEEECVKVAGAGARTGKDTSDHDHQC